MQQASVETKSAAPRFLIESEEKNDSKMEGVKIRKWTQKEYYKMAELGFFDGKRVQLIEGEIIEMSPMNKPHATTIRRVIAVLRRFFDVGYLIDSQLPMTFGKLNEPEPDVSVIKGEIDDFVNSHPKTAELIVEVSDTTLRFDRTKKASLYAKNKIQDYWILNLKNRCLEVYRQPKKDKKLGYIYTENLIFTEDDKVSPLAKPDVRIKVADLLP